MKQIGLFTDIVYYTLSSIFTATVSAQTVAVKSLKTEYLPNPIGIDNPHPRFTWQVETDKPLPVNISGYRIVVGTDSASVSDGEGNVWETNSHRQLLEYAGKPLRPFTKYYWHIVARLDNNTIKSAIEHFETGLINQQNWYGNWISDNKSIDVKSAPYFRKTFSVQKKIVAARAYISSGGLYELYINGTRIGDHRLDPMFTRYDRRNLYVTYDVTDALKNGSNAIGVVLGNGWYNFQSMAVWDYERAPWRNRPTFCMDVRITYNDGSIAVISTDKSWKTALSPIIFNSIYTGEHYDARRELPGWNTTNFDDKKWESATIRQVPSANVVSQTLHPIRYVEKIPAASFKKINDTTGLFDIGRNIAGIAELTVNGDTGTIVRVIHAERLDKKGNIDQSNVDYFLSEETKSYDAFGTDIYYLSGKGMETFAPRFNYKGFRYVQVTSNKTIPLSKESLVAYAMHSDVPTVGYIASSNEVINKINKATQASYLANLFGYPTDCPQREKNGWTGDAHIAIETGLYNFDGITVYEKWLADIRDEQQPNGTLPAIVPTDGWGYEWGNGPDWTSVIAIIPWDIYLFYGDTKILKDNYENIKRYVNRITTTAPDGLTSWGLGDWIPVKSQTPVELTSSIYYYADVDILSKVAKLLNQYIDAEKYSQLKEKIKSAINKKYLNKEKGIYGEGFQTELAAPLFWGVVPDDLKTKVAESLAKAVAANNYHLDVGLLGTKAILSALSDNGQAATAYKLAAQREYPSWGWWIVNGATTLYENWNIDAQRDLSQNHIMFGEISAWLYKGLGGIKPDENAPGFKNVVLSPNFVEGLDFFTAEHDGPYGKIISSWKQSHNEIEYDITVPPNSTATVTFPTLKNKSIYLDNQQMKDTEPIKVSSGRHVFTIR
ncbi:MAG: family 78 glycoside hydrolase catalytic domain [Chitinophagaceae bacterium]